MELFTANGIVSSKLDDKQDDFIFEKVTSNFLMAMFIAPLPMVYIFCSFFAGVCFQFLTA